MAMFRQLLAASIDLQVVVKSHSTIHKNLLWPHPLRIIAVTGFGSCKIDIVGKAFDVKAID